MKCSLKRSFSIKAEAMEVYRYIRRLERLSRQLYLGSSDRRRIMNIDPSFCDEVWLSGLTWRLKDGELSFILLVIEYLIGRIVRRTNLLDLTLVDELITICDSYWLVQNLSNDYCFMINNNARHFRNSMNDSKQCLGDQYDENCPEVRQLVGSQNGLHDGYLAMVQGVCRNTLNSLYSLNKSLIDLAFDENKSPKILQEIILQPWNNRFMRQTISLHRNLSHHFASNSFYGKSAIDEMRRFHEHYNSQRGHIAELEKEYALATEKLHKMLKDRISLSVSS